MKLYTSYFYQLRFFPRNLVALNTTIWPPKYVKLGTKDSRGVLLIDCPPLKPGVECAGLCDGKCDPKHPKDCQFLLNYYNQLQKINLKVFFEHLERLKKRIERFEEIDNVNFAFIVFESPKNECSERWAIQKWLHKNNIDIQEWRN